MQNPFKRGLRKKLDFIRLFRIISIIILFLIPIFRIHSIRSIASFKKFVQLFRQIWYSHGCFFGRDSREMFSPLYLDNFISATRITPQVGKSARCARRPRRSKLRIFRFRASTKAQSLRCFSSPHKAMRLCGGPDNSGVFRRWHAPRNFGTFCPEVRLLAVLPQPGYPFSDGHSVSKVLSIDELP